MTPHSEVHAAVVSRGLRTGMTYHEVRDNKWTQCEGEDAATHRLCTESAPCSACKFLDGALCECGESFYAHVQDLDCPHNNGNSFCLASWPKPEGDSITSRKEPPMVYAASDNNTPKETNMVEPKKTRINRATWHESAIGQGAISRVLLALQDEPARAWLLCDIVKVSGFLQSDVKLALDHLLSTGAIAQHGKAKGTRYAVAGFTDWPLPTREKKAKEFVVLSETVGEPKSEALVDE